MFCRKWFGGKCPKIVTAYEYEVNCRCSKINKLIDWFSKNIRVIDDIYDVDGRAQEQGAERGVGAGTRDEEGVCCLLSRGGGISLEGGKVWGFIGHYIFINTPTKTLTLRPYQY